MLAHKTQRKHCTIVRARYGSRAPACSNSDEARAKVACRIKAGLCERRKDADEHGDGEADEEGRHGLQGGGAVERLVLAVGECKDHQYHQQRAERLAQRRSQCCDAWCDGQGKARIGKRLAERDRRPKACRSAALEVVAELELIDERFPHAVYDSSGEHSTEEL